RLPAIHSPDRCNAPRHRPGCSDRPRPAPNPARRAARPEQADRSFRRRLLALERRQAVVAHHAGFLTRLARLAPGRGGLGRSLLVGLFLLRACSLAGSLDLLRTGVAALELLDGPTLEA